MFGKNKGSDANKNTYRDSVPRRHSGGASRHGAGDRSLPLEEPAWAKRRDNRNRRLPQEKPAEPGRLSRLCDWGKFRLIVVAVFFLSVGCALWARAYYLQINKGPEYAERAKRQHTAKENIRGVRGNILDRNGHILAKSVECESIWVNPAQIKDKHEAAQELARALRLPRKKVAAALNEKKTFVYLARKVDYNTVKAVQALKLTGVYTDTEYERVYPGKQLAGQLLGFVNIDDNGIEGLEKSLQSSLAGRSVTRVVERDAAGRRLLPFGAGGIGDLRGRDVRLTIDKQVQFFAEEALAENVRKFEARWGGCLVVDVSNGDILAWAQYPFFNPNKVADTPAADRKNRLATDMLEQGSTIKSFLLASALQEGVVNRDTVINCENGKWKFGRRILHDTHPYGKLNVEQILHVSSNIGAAKIGLELGAEKYYSYLNRLGFGVPTGLPLAGESRGILRNYRRWADIDLATASFGQSFSTTMVQMAQAYLCLAGDGVKRPLRLVLDDEPYGADPTLGNARSWDGASVALAHATAPGQSDAMRAVGEQPMRIFSPRTTSAIRAMLREVVEVEGGTGKQARIPGIEVGGKTGTAQKADASGRYGSGRVGSFVGMVPIDKPRFLVYVLLDEPTRSQYGGVIAAPVFRHVGMNTMAYHGLLPNRELEPEQADVAVAANRQNGKTPPAAPAPALKTAREAQRQKAPETRPDQRVVNADNDALVPTVVGMGLRNAVEAFAQRGIVPTIKGRGGIVSRQTPESGSPWPSGGAKCILWMEEDS